MCPRSLVCGSTVCAFDCTYRSGITPETVAAGGSLRDAVAELVAFVETELIGKGRTFCLVAHGSWDLPLQLRREANDKAIVLPEWMLKYIDLRTAYTIWKVLSAPVSLCSFRFPSHG